MSQSAVIFGLSGPKLTAAERAFFRDCDPWAFILFRRNIETPTQVKRLTQDLRDCVGRDCLIFVDQEGGRVQRFGPPHWRQITGAWRFGDKYSRNKKAALAACYMNFRLMAHELRAVGVTANCAPVLDIPIQGADPIISDRAFSTHPDALIALSHAALAGLSAGGVAGVIKHIPGHGRADVDSHKALPIIKDSLATLRSTDFVPFQALRDTPMAMTAHVRLDSVDASKPITLSARGMRDIVRGEIGYDGLVMTDDLDMKALSGGLTKLTQTALNAGNDVVLQCSGKLPAMVKVAKGVTPLTGKALERARLAENSTHFAEDCDADAMYDDYKTAMLGVAELTA